MKILFYLCTLLTGLVPGLLSAQWMDDFSDGNLIENPFWHGDTAQFVFQDDRLQLNADEAGESNLYAAVELGNESFIEWKFSIELDFSPSQNNGIIIYLLASDSMLWNQASDVEGPIYFLKIGESDALDAIELYMQSSSTNEPVLMCRGMDSYVANAFHRKYKIQLLDGNWKIYSASGNSPYYELETEYLATETIIVNGFMGLTLKYTSSNTSNFYLDDVSVKAYFPDTIPPQLSALQIIDSTHLQLTFSEAIDSAFIELSQFFIVDMLTYPTALNFTNPALTSMILEFESAFLPWTVLYFQITDLRDIEGNSNPLINSDFVYSPGYIAKEGDLVFSEILPDPSPAVGLPDLEFIEIFNASDSILDLHDYSLWNSGISSLLSSFQLYPDSFLVLCKAGEEGLFNPSIPVLGIENWVTLVNAADSLRLINSSGEIVDHVYYKNDWYESSLKSEGGWSLEKIDPAIGCKGEVNWKESVAITGGTPGMQNSVDGKEIENEVYFGKAHLADSTTIEIALYGEIAQDISKTMTSTSPPFTINWEASYWNQHTLKLRCEAPFNEDEVYQLTLHHLPSCEGKLIDEKNFVFAFPKKADPGDVLINEILFNAYSGAHDFVEIINRSDKFIDLKEWRIHELEDDLLVEDARLFENTHLIAPGEIQAFSEDVADLAMHYLASKREQLFEVSDLPNFSDKEGKAVLLSDDFVTIDSLAYNEDMHFQLLDDLNGVSLERINSSSSGSGKNQWASASESVQFATPGYRNSQFWSGQNSEFGISMDPPFFTPDNDGDKDKLIIQYRLDKGGWQAKVAIFDKHGALVKEIANNTWVESEGIFNWDGLNNNNESISVGIYLVYFEAFNSIGDRKVYKAACVLGD